MANYNATMGQIDLPSFDANKIGQQIGGNVASLVKGGQSIYDEATGNTPAVKIDKFIQAYNNPNDTTIFGGIEGSLRTEKLARLLLPLDRELSGKYMQKAQEEKKREQGLAQNKTVVDAMKTVPTTEEDTEGKTAIEAEIKLIEDELTSRTGRGYTQEGMSPIPEKIDTPFKSPISFMDKLPIAGNIINKPSYTQRYGLQ